MKKSKLLIIICVLVLLIVICVLTLKVLNQNDKLPFEGVSWVRYENDQQYLTFYENGHFSYYCACGNPVDNADICETYTYNKLNKTIILDCGEGMTEKIEIISYDEKNLKLKFGNDIREFINQKYEDELEEEE